MSQSRAEREPFLKRLIETSKTQRNDLHHLQNKCDIIKQLHKESCGAEDTSVML